MGNILILISCSRVKSEENSEFCTIQKFIDSIKENKGKFFEKRKNIKDWIQKEWVVDKESGENRKRIENRELIDGPDFGGNIQGKKYLPAYKRYKGRFFTELDEEDWEKAKEKGYHILIVSGLYGLISFEDSIQNYDCHLTDEIIGGNYKGKTLKDYWGETLTDGLIDYIKEKKIDMIIDLISEETYQYSIKWKEIEEDKELRILHRVFEKEAGPRFNFLYNLGRFFKYDIINKSPEEVRKIKVSKPGDLHFIERNYFEGNDRIIFESKLYELGFDIVKRDIVRNPEPWIRSRFGNYYDLLTQEEQNYCKEGKKRYEKCIEDGLDLDVSCVLNWWKAVESVKGRFLKKLFELFCPFQEGIKKVTFPAVKDKEIGIKIIELRRDNKGGIKYYPYISIYETELLFSLCCYPSKYIPKPINERIIRTKNIPEELKNTVERVKNFMKNSSIFKTGEFIGFMDEQRDLRNKLKGDLINTEEIKGKVEKFHDLFFDKGKSILIAYLILIEELKKGR